MKVILPVLFLFVSLPSFSQSKKGEIVFVNAFWGYKFYKDGVKHTTGSIMREMKTNEEAYWMMKQARISNTIGGVIGFLAGP